MGATSTSPSTDLASGALSLAGDDGDFEADRPSSEREQLLAFVLRAGGLGYWRLDLASGQLQCSPGCRANFGLGPGDDLSSYDALRSYIHPDDRAAMASRVQVALGSGSEYEAEYRVLPPSGGERWIAARGRVVLGPDGRPCGLAGITADITARKQAELDRERLVQELATERARLKALVDNLPVGVVMAEAPSGRIVLGNAAFQQIVGHQMLSSQSVDDYAAWAGFHPDGRPVGAHEWPLARALAGEVSPPEDFRYRRPDGTDRWMRISGAPICDEAGGVTGACVVVVDVGRERAAVEFERQLIGIVSHDLRNPLSAIALGIATLGQGTLDVQQRQRVKRIDAATGRAIRLIRDLLDFTAARLGSGIPVVRRPFDLGALVEEVIDGLRAVHGTRLIETTLRGRLKGSWDGDRVNQVVTNLIENAIKYGAPERPIRVTVHGSDDGAAIEVWNGGAGIAPEALARLFEPMQRGSGSMDGASRSVGLGLYIVKHLVAAHGGTVAVRSSSADGTTFRVWLPC